EERLLRHGGLPADGVDHRPITRVERGSPIRYPASLCRVEKIESDDVEAEAGERAGAVDHPRASLTRAGAVPEDEHGVDGIMVRRVDERRRCPSRPDHDVQLVRISQADPGPPRRSSNRW